MMTSRALKSSSISLRPRRPANVRTTSNSSTQSQDLSTVAENGAVNSESDEQHNSIALDSPGHSPLPSPTPNDTPQRIGRSRPIKIELPPRRQSGPVCGYTPTPPEPLSARGDLPGGYFPLHEDISRTYKPHPFHPESSSKLASGLKSPRNMPDMNSPQYTPMGHSIPTGSTDLGTTFRLPPPAESLSMNMNMNMSIPMGKYHPSNYKNKSKQAKAKPEQEAAPPQPNAPHHSRKKSDIRKKLQQYQKDMVEQAALAGRIQVPMAKPASPRLAPLGSPGPVTPMALEESAGYLVAGTGQSMSDLNHQDMVSRMIQAEEERDRNKRNGTTSPVPVRWGD